MELETQKFLRGGGTLDGLRARNAIEVRSANLCGHDVVSLNYHHLSPMDDPISRECRALILEVGTWDVVSRSFEKFFNAGEPNARETEALFDWPSAAWSEKMDGSLISVFEYRGQWHCATRSRADASGTISGRSQTYRWLFERSLEHWGATWGTFTDKLDPQRFYSFELTGPDNPVVVQYAQPDVTWIGCWDRQTLEELDIAALPCIEDTGSWDAYNDPEMSGHFFYFAPAPTMYPKDIADAQARLADAHWWENEGMVVRDLNFRRLKLKSPDYLRAAKAVGNAASDKQKLALIVGGKLDDALSHLPAWAKMRVEEIGDALNEIAKHLEGMYGAIKDLDTQKEFAAYATKLPCYAQLFDMRKGLTAGQALDNTRLETLVALLDKMVGFSIDG